MTEVTERPVDHNGHMPAGPRHFVTDYTDGIGDLGARPVVTAEDILAGRAPWQRPPMTGNRPRLSTRQAADLIRDYAKLMLSNVLSELDDEYIVGAYMELDDPAAVADELTGTIADDATRMFCSWTCTGHCMQCKWCLVVEEIVADGDDGVQHLLAGPR